MNKRGQTTVQIGTIIVLAIGLIVGVILLQASAQNNDAVVNTRTATNVTYTSPTSGSTIDLTGQDLIGTATVVNATDGATVPASNYTISEAVSATSGVKSIQYTNNDADWNSVSVNISYTYGGDGYSSDAGGRAMANLIIIMAGLALLAFVLVAVIGKDSAMAMLGK